MGANTLYARLSRHLFSSEMATVAYIYSWKRIVDFKPHKKALPGDYTSMDISKSDYYFTLYFLHLYRNLYVGLLSEEKAQSYNEHQIKRKI